jgi:hypothetical protein
LQNKIIGRRDFKAGLITPVIVRTDPKTSGDFRRLVPEMIEPSG